MPSIKFFLGKGSLDPRKKSVLFIHGSGGSHYTWDLQSSLENEFNIIAIDLPGHGESKGEGLKTVEEFSNALHQLIHQEFSNYLPLILVGHSLGGAIVQQYSLKHPQDLLGIVLVGTGAKLRVMDQILDNLLDDFEEIVNLIAQYAFHKETDPRIIQKSIDQLLECPPNIMLQDFKACNEFNLFTEIKNISVPTLIICGTNDLLTPPKYSKYLHENIANSKLVEIPDAGHMVMLEQVQPFNQALKSFIREL
ncbi:MAG: alpha/beta fold hydrolase [Candidatus Hermodarchaeota archaeon]